MPRAAVNDNNRVALRVRPADKAVIVRAARPRANGYDHLHPAHRRCGKPGRSSKNTNASNLRGATAVS